MSKTTSVLAFSAIGNFADIAKMLDYCKKHSSEETYSAVFKSFKKAIAFLLIIIFVFLSVFVAGVIHFSKDLDSKVTANNISYSFEKRGHVGNGVVWYIDNEKYEIDISHFGYDINDYEERTDFSIYLDDDHNVVDISPSVKGVTGADKMMYWVLGFIILFSAILIVFAIWLGYSKSRLNPMREYAAYVKWFRNKSENEEWYHGYNR